MKVNFAQAGRTLVARVSGELDMLAAGEFQKQLEEALEQKQARHLVLNFSEVSFIDSSGLGVILGRYKKLSQIGGKMAVAEPQPQVKRILELSGILRIMNIHPTEEAAVKQM